MSRKIAEGDSNRVGGSNWVLHPMPFFFNGVNLFRSRVSQSKNFEVRIMQFLIDAAAMGA